jgi:dimethyl sulfoxide reductase membrane subunit
MVTTTQSIKTQGAVASPWLWIYILAALAGFSAWIYQLVVGMEVTALGQQVVWGMYIAAFFTAVGAGAVLLAMTGLSEFGLVLTLENRLQSLSLALSSFVVGGILIAMDVGNPLALWRVVSGFEFSSMMTWDFWLLVIAGIIALIYLLQARSGQPQKLLGGLGLVAAVAVVTAEGWMLTTLESRSMWGSGVVVLSFLVGAMIAGGSVAVLAQPAAATRLRLFLTATLGLSLMLLLVEVFTGLLSGSPRSLAEIRNLLNGAPAPIFWFHLFGGIALPLILLRSGMIRWAAGLALAGVLAEKLWLLAAGQAEPWVNLPVGAYFPSWVEFVAVIGMAAFGFVVYQGLTVILKEK